MITFDEALAKVLRAAQPVGTESVPLHAAHGRILSEPIIAALDAPRAAVSAMDGYAFRESDLPEARLVGTSYPGRPYGGTLGAGECVRVFTGAAVPEGTDRVVVQEMVRNAGDRVRLEGRPAAGRHIRNRGSDFRAGEVLLSAGRRLDPRALLAVAGADLADVSVWRRPRVAVVSTGDELVSPGAARLSPVAVPESVSVGVSALAVESGACVVSLGRVPDDPVRLEEAFRAALGTADLVVITGGASEGQKDFAKPVMEVLGVGFLFRQVAMKPGKPVWFGRLGRAHVLGLPGNPTSAMVAARLFLVPLIVGLAGSNAAAALRWRKAELTSAVPATSDRDTFLRGVSDGMGIRSLGNQDSGSQRTLAEAMVLIRCQARAPAFEAGAIVDVIDL